MSSSEPTVIFGPRICGDYSDAIQRIVAHADGSAHTAMLNFQTRTWQRGALLSRAVSNLMFLVPSKIYSLSISPEKVDRLVPFPGYCQVISLPRRPTSRLTQR